LSSLIRDPWLIPSLNLSRKHVNLLLKRVFQFSIVFPDVLEFFLMVFLHPGHFGVNSFQFHHMVLFHFTHLELEFLVLTNQDSHNSGMLTTLFGEYY
jgi:hypothetical protein